MNANELAEILVSDSKHTSGRFTYSSRYIADIATMLRQQQAEIEAGKIIIKGYSKIIDEQKAQIERMNLVEKLRLELIGDKFCEANCIWSDHHPDCPIGKAQDK